MEIRKGTLKDAEQVAAVEAACFPPAEAASKEAIAARMAVYPRHFLLLMDGGELIGFIDGMVTDEADLEDVMYHDASLHRENGSWQMIFGVNTIPSRRRQGNGARLISAFIEEARKEGRRGVVLTCKAEKIHYYKRFGFADEGLSPSNHGQAQWYQMRLTF